MTAVPATCVRLRSVFDGGGDALVEEMHRHQPDAALSETFDVAYAERDDTIMDVFSPASASGPLPTVVWIHGGAWISGSKEHVNPYLRILAAEGYTAIGVNYTRGPEAAYPTAVEQLNQALAHIDEHADELHADPDRIASCWPATQQARSWPASSRRSSPAPTTPRS